MRHWIMGMGVMLVALGAAAETPLTVMTFNLRHGLARDGDNSWPLRKDILVNTIKAAAPDFVGVQECLLIQADYIASSLPDYHWFGIGREANGGGEMCAIFYRKSLLNPIEARNFWISETPDVPGSRSWETGCPRMVTWIKFWNRETKAFFYHINTHLDHISETARVNGARLIVEHIAKLPGDVPVIVTGDFNSQGGDSDAWRTLTGAGLTDSWLAADKKEGPETTCSGFGPPAPGATQRIDWILVRGQASIASCSPVTREENGRYPSDHYPVVAKLALK